MVFDNRGFASIRTLFWLTFFVLLVYAGVKLVPPYFSYQMMSYEVESEAKNAEHYTDEQIFKHIMEKAASWWIPLESEAVEIERGYEDISITVKWTIEVSFFDRYKRIFDYRIAVTKPLKSA